MPYGGGFEKRGLMHLSVHLRIRRGLRKVRPAWKTGLVNSTQNHIHVMKVKPIHLVLALFVTSTGVMLVKGKQAAPARQTSTHASLVARGKYLVQLGGCTDCHTRKEMTERGPVDDPAMLLAGHPEGLILPPPEHQAGPWGAATAGMTAWTGPWGVSYASNLTPDPETGLGGWTEAEFIAALRIGKHKGNGRPILPPMPWQPLSEAQEEDLKAMFAYLRSLPPVKNRVPEPQPPAAATAQAGPVPEQR